MKIYDTSKIRNVALLGHLGSGKTTLTESMLYVCGQTKQKNEIEKKSTYSDFLYEEHIKQASLSTSLIPIEYKQEYKINILDTPGSDELFGDLSQSLAAVKSAVIVIDATKGVEVGTERVWNEIRKRRIPGIIFVNKMDKENIDFDKTLSNIREKLGKAAIPFVLPLGKQHTFDGFINIIKEKAYIFDEKGNMTEENIYEDKLSKVHKLHSQILETVATTSEELLDKYFSGENISDEELYIGLKNAIISGDLIPVLVGSSLKNVGIKTLLHMLVHYMPNPNDLKPMKGIYNSNILERKTDNKEPFSGYIFKTLVDPFLGTINFVKIISGSLKIGQEVYYSKTNSCIKVNQLFTLMGKNQINIDTFNAGDICCIAKADLETSSTISDPKNPIIYNLSEKITPIIYVSVLPKNKQDEDKISQALQKLNLEDPSIQIIRNKETNQLLLGGQGMTHIGFILDRMRSMFKVDTTIEDQKIVYRETIKKQVEAEGKHKKQSGGAGQFGHVFIRFIPNIDKDFEFSEEIFGGSVPKNYFPAVEKGLEESFEHGPLASFPVIGIKAILYDGSYHPVDSNEISFKLAAAQAFKKACETANPTILEPVMSVDITVKDMFVGDVMGDINKRRGRVLGMDQGEGYQVIHCEIPEAEIIKYAIDLKAMTQGSGLFTRTFLRYEEVPHNLIDKIVSQYKKH